MLVNVLILILMFMPSQHPIHVSMTNIEYDINNHEYKVIIKVFSDDFQKNIKVLYGIDLNLGKKNQAENYQKIISKYFSRTLKIRFNGNIQNLHFISKKCNFEAIWFKFKLNDKSNIKKINIINNIMNDYYRDQTNLLIFTKEDMQEAFNLDYGNTEAEIILKK